MSAKHLSKIASRKNGTRVIKSFICAEWAAVPMGNSLTINHSAPKTIHTGPMGKLFYDSISAHKALCSRPQLTGNTVYPPAAPFRKMDNSVSLTGTQRGMCGRTGER